jgi:hypothetical protein
MYIALHISLYTTYILPHMLSIYYPHIYVCVCVRARGVELHLYLCLFCMFSIQENNYVSFSLVLFMHTMKKTFLERSPPKNGITTKQSLANKLNFAIPNF